VELYPDIDEREVRVTAHNYARSRNKAHYRELFRIIRGAAEKQRLLYR
jgi:ribosome-associated protein